MARQLFGTDGIRGVAGEYPLDRATARAVGAALGAWIEETGSSHEVVIGMDTRESGSWLAAEVAAGLAPHGGQVRFAGVTTTPGIAFLARKGPFSAGVMISASHNPYQDNGIKILGHNGYKLPDDEEERLETRIFEQLRQPASAPAPELRIDAGLDHAYIEHLAATVSRDLSGLRLVVDCANGGASHLAPKLFERLGAHVHPIGSSPNGRNINLDSGSLHLELLQAAVLEQKADAGVAFDGDADRALFVAPSGRLIDGDAVLLIAARDLMAQNRLNGRDGKPVVVATVMSNLGLERALSAHGIRLARTPVGDKYVLDEMLKAGAVLGGEQSGHIIFLDYATTGDGMLTALRVFEIARKTGQTLDQLAAEMKVYPQRLVNVRVRERKPLEDLPAVREQIRAAETAFGETGRVLVRFSGTEPLARVMVEGPDQSQVDDYATRIATQIKQDLG